MGRHGGRPSPEMNHLAGAVRPKSTPFRGADQAHALQGLVNIDP